MEKIPIILVVDDEDRNRRLLEALLVPLGYHVILASDGEEALQKVQGIPPDIILLDIMMPGLNGFEVAKRLKENEETKIIPIVMVTSLQDIGSRIRALEAGADDFLTKPVDLSELKARVRSSLQVKAYHDHMRNYQKELEAEVEKRTEELKQALETAKIASLDTIHRLSCASEYKDEDTGAHINRMSNYSSVVAHQMGLTRDEVDTILYAAPMHDAGKIGIPDKVLLKPGKLDPGEWEIMKQHTTIGGKILSNSDSEFIKLAEVIALTHHEKWDGSGYPRGLKGAAIPLAGRITAIADVFDALMSKRPYKEPFSLEKSFAIIREGQGSHFDPEVVEAFFAVEKEILLIKETFRDKEPSLFIQMRGIEQK
ncbi:HD domain-containing phosphohydrolase [Desulfobacula sp.]|jgi:putative two-component system response regulator|uniref:HD domain-containing phosphohydrolase n=1 Tax=Desulfobacula sp. TaxID=2593537 RepID=UPI001D36D390|nr:two-component system response regulator [Deltaproteobacteria bacterium]MBT4508266.1 two-component system response regulator [Desulfobacula sp.]